MSLKTLSSVLCLAVLLLSFTCTIYAQNEFVGTFPDNTYGDGHLYLCRDSDEVQGAYTTGDGNVVGIIRGEVQTNTHTPDNNKELIGTWIEGGGLWGEFNLTWDSSNSGFNGYWTYENRDRANTRHFEWSEERSSETEPEEDECWAAFDVDPISSYDGEYDQDNVRSEICSTETNGQLRVTLQFWSNVTNSNGFEQHICFDNNRVCTGTYQNDNGEYGTVVFIFTDEDGATRYFSYNGIDNFENYNFDSESPNLNETTSPDCVPEWSNKNNPFWNGLFMVPAIPTTTGSDYLQLYNHMGKVSGVLSTSSTVQGSIIGIVQGEVASNGTTFSGKWYSFDDEAYDFLKAKYEDSLDDYYCWNGTIVMHKDRDGYLECSDGSERAQINTDKNHVFSTAYESFFTKDGHIDGVWYDAYDEIEDVDQRTTVCQDDDEAVMNYWEKEDGSIIGVMLGEKFDGRAGYVAFYNESESQHSTSDFGLGFYVRYPLLNVLRGMWREHGSLSLFSSRNRDGPFENDKESFDGTCARYPGQKIHPDTSPMTSPSSPQGSPQPTDSSIATSTTNVSLMVVMVIAVVVSMVF